MHALLELALGHLAVRHEEADVGQRLLELQRSLLDRLDAIVQVERLASTSVLPLERGLDELLVELPHGGADRKPAARRRLDDRDVPEPGERHVERPRESGSRRARARRPRGGATGAAPSARRRSAAPRRARRAPGSSARRRARGRGASPRARRPSPPGTRRGSGFWSARERKRETISTLTGKSRKRSRKVFQCCSARIVVGQSTSVCLPPSAAMKAARTATSVFPKPTSPHTSRSIGRGASRSSFTASIACIWSSVSRYANDASSRSSQSPPTSNAWPGACWRRAYRASSSPASSRTDSRARLLRFAHALPPSLDSAGDFASAPM